MSEPLGRKMWTAGLRNTSDPRKLVCWYNKARDDCEPVHVFTPDELRAALKEAFKAARAATIELPGEEHEGHLVEGLKFVYPNVTDYLGKLGL